MDWKNVLERAGWTALQAGLAAIVVVPAVTDGLDAWAAVVASAASAAIAALISFAKTVAQDKLGS